MKVAFVCSEDERLGIEYLSAVLKENGHQTELTFDPRLFSQSRTLSRIFDMREHNLERIKQLRPDIVAFSVSTSDYQWALEIASLIKREIDVPIIFGGPHPTLVPDLAIKNDSVDMVCIGEGEEAFLELVNSLEAGKKIYNIKNIWFKNNGKVIKNEVRPLLNMDRLPFPDKKLFLEELPSSYVFLRHPTFMTSRGCPFACSYCANDFLRRLQCDKDKWVRRMSVDNAIAQLAHIKQVCNAKYYFFFDDIFTLDVNWLREFTVRYKREIDIPFSCFSHATTLTEEVANLLKTAGCRLVMMGVQSGSESLRKAVLNRFESNKQIIEAAAHCRKIKLPFSVDHIIDLPFEKEGDLIESLNLYNKLRPSVVNVYELLYFPATEIVKTAKEAEILDEKSENLINEGKHVLYHHFILIPHERHFKKSSYRRYALLFSMLPILPQSLADRIINSRRLSAFFSFLPVSLVSLVKICVNLRIGLGFLYLAILRNQLHWMLRIVVYKLKRLCRQHAT